MDFREVDRRYADLKQQYDNGSLSHEEFGAQLKQMMVQDDEGRWWAKSRETGIWHYYDDSAWIQGTPPGYQSVTPDSVTDDSPVQALSALHPEGTEKGENRRRWALLWVLAAGLLAVVALVGMWTYLQGGDDTTVESANDAVSEGSPSEEASKPAPGYQLVKHESGSLSVEVPSGWQVSPAEYTEFEGERVGPSMTAATDLNAWMDPNSLTAGVFFQGSRKLTQRYNTNDQLLDSWPFDYSARCESLGARQGFDRYPYSGKMQEWKNCGDNGDHNLLVVVAAPEDRECLLILYIATHNEADRKVSQHILETFEADCGGIT